MKKILFLFVIMFVYVVNIQATEKFYLGEKIPNMYIEQKDGVNWHNSAPFIIKRQNGDFVYCLNPFLIANTEEPYNIYKANNTIFNMTQKELDEVNLIAYYGYQYKNHTDIKWYGITQFLIWEALGIDEVYFTDVYHGSKIVAYENELNELRTLVNSHLTLPSFANNHYNYTINSSYEINDSNNILSNYKILESDIDAIIENNKLKINTKKDGIYKITFIRENPINRDYLLYYKEGSQALIYPGRTSDIIFSISIEVHSGSITINKKDSENKYRENVTLEGAIYGVYNSTELITTIKTDENGIGYIDNLPFGNYYIKEITPSLGYTLDFETYEINITRENKEVLITSYEKIIQGNIIINKYYGYEDNYELEDGAIFEIYDINDNLIGIHETENGVISAKLEYGDYYIIQVEGKDGYKFIDKFNILINEEKDYEYDLYNDFIPIIVEVPDTYKISYKFLVSSAFTFCGFIILIIGLTKKTTH